MGLTHAQTVYFQEVTNSRLDPHMFMPSSNVVIILVAVVEHHWCGYVADRLHVLCYNWNASLEHGISKIIIHGKLHTTVHKNKF